jgi:hypothetical protein
MPQFIPPSLRLAFQQGTWHRSRIPGSIYHGLRVPSKMDLELIPDLSIIERDTSHIAKLSTLVEFHRDPRFRWHLCYDWSSTGERNLPWLDLNHATVIGGGADYGDDLWLILDTRYDTEDPRVLYNMFGAHSHSATWHELCPTLSSFLSLAAGGEA